MLNLKKKKKFKDFIIHIKMESQLLQNQNQH